ncbi:MAG: hypothetical protein KatS3mg104_2496 [Phycisphaerae bacterium]|jgi:beta-galactosidase|nr:MAG: hypothetical protein KatS3mg104_2496 [Phycisphaerae bacterium]
MSAIPRVSIVNICDNLMQRRFKTLAPMPIGCVFLPWPGLTQEEARHHFRLMKRLGFTCLKQTMPTPEWPVHRTLMLAMEEGIWPFWYAEGGFEPVTVELLGKLGLDRNMSLDEALSHPIVIEYQKGVYRKRIERSSQPVPISGDGGEPSVKAVPGVVGDVKGHELHPDAEPAFLDWLKQQYGDVQTLKRAWNLDHVGIGEHCTDWKTWNDVARRWRKEVPDREYRHLRDIMRFRADMFTRDYVQSRIRHRDRTDPYEPLRAGGEMGLFLPFSSRGTDMEQIACAMAEGGSFYPSIHLAWHFEEVSFEVARPVYMQASLAADWAKGIWSATWESTGGPQYFSGGKSPFVKEMSDQTPGFTVDSGTMTQLMLSYLAAGFKGVGLWAWNHRTAGWEGGEYALLDRNHQLTERAITAGQIGQAMIRHRRELWGSEKSPLVGVMWDWDNEAIWAAMSVTGRDHYKNIPVRARIGVSRALINANVPWEHVTTRNLSGGLGGRYPVIYLPAFISITEQLQSLLEQYVHQGGRLVIDMPGAYYDEYGRIIQTGRGSWFERVFGCTLDEFHYGRSINTPRTVGTTRIEGFIAQLTPTRANVKCRYKETGLPAVTENRFGKGTSVVIGFEASGACWRPGNRSMEKSLIRYTLGKLKSPFLCNLIVYRLFGPRADHYFLINDGPRKVASLRFRGLKYRSFSDPVQNKSIRSIRSVPVEAYSGRWIRAEK